MERLTVWNGTKWVLPQGRTHDGKSYWRLIAEKLSQYENLGEPEDLVRKDSVRWEKLYTAEDIEEDFFDVS